MRRVHVCIALTVMLLAIAGCETHGKYTQAFLDESQRGMLRMRGSLQYDAAVQQFESGNLTLAMSSVESAIGLVPENAKGHALRGRILLEQGQTRPALASLQRGQELDPTDPTIPYYRGIGYERLDEFEAALGAYEFASALDPGHAQYRLAAAETLVQLDRLDDAQALLEGSARPFGSDATLRQMLGHIALLQGRPNEAIGYLTDATLLRPDDVVLSEDLCYAQIAARRFAQAEATLRRLAERGQIDDRPDLQHLHAACLIELDRPIEARRILFGIIRSKDGAGDADAWTKLIDVALMLNHDDLLQTVAYRLMSMAPARHEGYLAMALWQRRQGDLDGALRSVTRSIKRANGAPAPRHLEAVIQRALHPDGAAG